MNALLVFLIGFLFLCGYVWHNTPSRELPRYGSEPPLRNKGSSTRPSGTVQPDSMARRALPPPESRPPSEEPTSPRPSARIPSFSVALNRYSAQRSIRSVNFYCHAPRAKRVCLIGDFNGWDPAAHPMKPQPTGTWTLTIPLHQGHHLYYYLVDGKPTLDPNAEGTVRNDRDELVSLMPVS